VPCNASDLSLRYISFPLLILAKSCKLVPLMLVGSVLNKTRYSLHEYAAVGLISAGVAVFMVKPSTFSGASSNPLSSELIGLGLAATNLLIDGWVG
jgi:solute carrier family 35 (UDP-galactose transporter), member B1